MTQQGSDEGRSGLAKDFSKDASAQEARKKPPSGPPIALVTDIPFWENTLGSHMRIQGVARALSAIAPLRVFFLRSTPPKLVRAFLQLGLENAELISYKRFAGLQNPAPAQLSALPFYHGKSVEDFNSALRAWLAQTPVRAVVFEYIRLGYLKDACKPGTLALLDMHDVMSERALSLAQAGLKASIQIDARSEREILSAFDGALTISRADDRHLREVMGLANGLYLPYSAPPFPLVARKGDGRSLLFVGGDTAPNIAGLRWFLDQLWPLLRPLGFRLEVVGAVCNSFKEAASAQLRLHGVQENLAPFLAAADVAVNPVFVGGGLKIKCLDALTAGLPCVTTAEGAAGLEHAQSAGLFVAHSRLEFFAHLLRLAKSPEERGLIGYLAPRFVAREFSDAAILTRLEAWLAERSAPQEARPAA